MFIKIWNSWVGWRKVYGIYVWIDSVFFVYIKGWVFLEEEVVLYVVFYVKMSLLVLDEEVWIF